MYCGRDAPIIYQETTGDPLVLLYSIYRCEKCRATFEYSDKYSEMVRWDFFIPSDYQHECTDIPRWNAAFYAPDTGYGHTEAGTFHLYKEAKLVLRLDFHPQNFTPTTFHEKVKTMLTFL